MLSAEYSLNRCVYFSAVTVDVPLKPDLLATMKSNNYLLNALVMMAAQDTGAQLGIQTENGMITESAGAHWCQSSLRCQTRQT